MSDFFFFNDTATTEIYTLSLHDALPISATGGRVLALRSVEFARNHHVPLHVRSSFTWEPGTWVGEEDPVRSEEHTSELQSRQYLVCRLLLEKKKKKYKPLLIHCEDCTVL